MCKFKNIYSHTRSLYLFIQSPLNNVYNQSILPKKMREGDN